MLAVKKNLKATFVHLSAAIGGILNNRQGKMRVIALHDISKENRDLFVEKMRWLKNNFNVISLEDMHKRNNIDFRRLNVALTFDDGFKEFFSFVFPVLKKLSIPATFFVPSGVLNAEGIQAENFSRNNLKRSRAFEFMTEEDIRTISKEPLFEIGGHTASHANLGSNFVDFDTEIIKDKFKLESVIGKKISFLSYPFGGIKNSNDSSVVAIKRAGYLASFTIIPSFWINNRNLFSVGRDSLSVEDSNMFWRDCLFGGYDALSILKNYIF